MKKENSEWADWDMDYKLPEDKINVQLTRKRVDGKILSVQTHMGEQIQLMSKISQQINATDYLSSHPSQPVMPSIYYIITFCFAPKATFLQRRAIFVGLNW